eukprot:IDg5899t1
MARCYLQCYPQPLRCCFRQPHYRVRCCPLPLLCRCTHPCRGRSCEQSASADRTPCFMPTRARIHSLQHEN